MTPGTYIPGIMYQYMIPGTYIPGTYQVRNYVPDTYNIGLHPKTKKKATPSTRTGKAVIDLGPKEACTGLTFVSQ